VLYAFCPVIDEIFRKTPLHNETNHVKMRYSFTVFSTKTVVIISEKIKIP